LKQTLKNMLDGDDDWFRERLLERFTRYAKVCTVSDSSRPSVPTTDGQWTLARLLVRELKDIGATDTELTSACYVFARIPATVSQERQQHLPVIGFLSHMDTVGDTRSIRTTPVVETHYNGDDIPLFNGLKISPSSDSALAAQVGRTIIHSDGYTPLGADDKAGIAEIITAVEYLLTHPNIEHPALDIIFSPDEETGRGLPGFERDKLRATYCYTLDGGGAPEIETECFNACSADIQFTGHAIHPGSARGVMVNAALMAATFATMLPRSESPEATDGYYGYYCVIDISGVGETAHVEILLRDFTREGIQRRIEALNTYARAVEAQFPGGIARVEITNTYANMKERIDQSPAVLSRLLAAGRALGCELRQKPIRGGTDGARLTEMGIPTPNIFTGGYNFHSKTEWAALDDMTLASKLVVTLAALWSEDPV
jgi:tripeptide aminopeptidase